MPETYPREIQRRRAKRTGVQLTLAPAQSGLTFKQMAIITFFTPLRMLVTEPIVIALALYVGFIFAVIFQFFVSIPAVLTMTYMFTVQQVGIAFISAIVGVLLAAATSAIFDRLSVSRHAKTQHDGKIPEEHTMLPGMLGGLLITASLFWIGWTASPKMHFMIPIIGTLVFIWGSALVL
ncbi:MAG: hypothetical protein Q9164_003410, partial [Protoblastenia rupestris]